MSSQRLIRSFVTLLVALGACWWAGREFGLANDELLGYLILSGELVVASGVVGLLLFGLIRLIRRN